LGKIITGRESQGACRQDELISGKPPVVKYFIIIIIIIIIIGGVGVSP
jgi:hypothetical protein